MPTKQREDPRHEAGVERRLPKRQQHAADDQRDGEGGLEAGRGKQPPFLGAASFQSKADEHAERRDRHRDRGLEEREHRRGQQTDAMRAEHHPERQQHQAWNWRRRQSEREPRPLPAPWRARRGADVPEPSIERIGDHSCSSAFLSRASTRWVLPRVMATRTARPLGRGVKCAADLLRRSAL